MTDGSVITVALIEDNRLVREGITALLNQLPDIEVVAAAADADATVLRQALPRVVLLDLSLQNGDSLRMAEQVKEELPEARIVVMDVLAFHEEIFEYVRAGVSGFIMKDASLQELAATVRSVAAGEDVLPAAMTGSLFSQIVRETVSNGRPVPPESVRMTPRERELIGLIAEGMSNREIASRLHISPNTVKSHLRNVMEKLTLHTRLQIAVYAHGQESR